MLKWLQQRGPRMANELLDFARVELNGGLGHGAGMKRIAEVWSSPIPMACIPIPYKWPKWPEWF